MKASASKPSFAEGALVALMLSALGSIAYVSLSLLFFSGVVISIVMAVLGGGYLFYLIVRSDRRGGKLLAFFVVSVLLLLCAVLPLSVAIILTAFIVGIWLLRSFYFRQGFMDSAFDLGLNLLSLAAAVTAALVSESHFLAFWTFFILQALHVYLPSLEENPSKSTPPPGERFRRAHENAESALNRMHNPAV